MRTSLMIRAVQRYAFSEKDEAAIWARFPGALGGSHGRGDQQLSGLRAIAHQWRSANALGRIGPVRAGRAEYTDHRIQLDRSGQFSRNRSCAAIQSFDPCMPCKLHLIFKGTDFASAIEVNTDGLI